MQFWSAAPCPSSWPFCPFAIFLPFSFTAVFHFHLSSTHFWSSSFGFALLWLPLPHKNKLPRGDSNSDAATYRCRKITKDWGHHSASHPPKTSTPASSPGRRLAAVSAPQLPVNHCVQLTGFVCLNSSAKLKASVLSMWTLPGEIFCQ